MPQFVNLQPLNVQTAKYLLLYGSFRRNFLLHSKVATFYILERLQLTCHAKLSTATCLALYLIFLHFFIKFFLFFFFGLQFSACYKEIFQRQHTNLHRARTAWKRDCCCHLTTVYTNCSCYCLLNSLPPDCQVC